LPELTKKDSKVVVQFGPNNTQQMAFIRLPEPKENESTTPPVPQQSSSNSGPPNKHFSASHPLHAVTANI